MRFLIRRIEKIPIDYTDLFIGIIFKSVHSHQQKLDVYIQDVKNNKGVIRIGTLIDKDRISIDSCRETALKMLHNQDFCFGHYMDLLNKETNKD